MEKIIDWKIINNIKTLEKRLDAICTLMYTRQCENAVYSDVLDKKRIIQRLHWEFMTLADDIDECKEYDRNEIFNLQDKIRDLEEKVKELSEYEKYKFMYEELTKK